MAFPTTLTWDVNNISTTVWREVLRFIPNLITENEDKLLRIAAMRGAIEPFAGGDKFNVNVRINGGMASSEIDPAAADPTTTLGTTAYQVLSASEYKVWHRTRNIYWAQTLPDLINSPRQLMDAFREQYVGNAMEILEEIVDDDQTPGGFFYTTGKLPSSGLTNAKAMFADQTSDFAEVDVSAYTAYKPTLVNATASTGANLLVSDLQSFYNATVRGGEGHATDMFTGETAWNKIRALYLSNSGGPVVASPMIGANMGMEDTIPYAQMLIHWSRFLASKHTSWDVTDGTTAEWAMLGIDFKNVKLRYAAGGETIPGDETGFLKRYNMPTLHATLPKYYQRVGWTGQWCFTGSRRTSGQLEGLQF